MTNVTHHHPPAVAVQKAYKPVIWKFLRALKAAARRRRGGSLPFARDRRGAAAVEFAFVIGPLFGLLFCICEIGFDWFSQAQIDHAAQSAARLIMTGNAQAMTSGGQPLNAAQFRTTVLCPMLPGYFNCANVIMNIQTFSSGVSPAGVYSLLNTAQTNLALPPLDNTQTTYCIGAGGANVLVQIVYPMPLLTNVFSKFPLTTYGGSTVILLQSSAVMKNEPFPAGTYTAPAGC